MDISEEELKELNDEMVKFAGFEIGPYGENGCHVVRPSDGLVMETPDFTRAMGPVIDHLMPKLGLCVMTFDTKRRFSKAIITSRRTGFSTEAQFDGKLTQSDLATGICLAIRRVESDNR